MAGELPDKYHVPQWLGTKVRRRFHVMAKPAGAACNLDCGYCFYLSKEKLAGGLGRGRMRDSQLELLIQQYIEGVTAGDVVFSWQGGEPTLRGLDFFRKAVALQAKHARPGQRIENDLQTNGMLLDAEWAQFLKEHRFLVGLSIDGRGNCTIAFASPSRVRRRSTVSWPPSICCGNTTSRSTR